MSARTWSQFAPPLLAALSWLPVGCSQVVCGTGTVERGETCVPADEQPGAAQCGMGTELGPGGKCVPSEPTFCDPETTMEVEDPETGVVTCVGTGGGCATELPCQPPDANRLTMCGRIFDTESDQVLTVPGATGTPCNPAAPSATGPCSLKVQFYDAIGFQMDPVGATPLQPESLLVDDCGRYRAVNLPLTSFGFVGVATDDATGLPDDRLLTGVATAQAEAMPARRFPLFTTRKTTEAPWTTAANPAGGPFRTQGVLAIIFRKAGLPVPGVVARRNGNVIPADDFYFSDPGVARTTVAPAQAMTGPNGTALIINSSSPAPHDGIGGEPPGCRWPSTLAATVPGVVFVQVKEAESVGGGPCP